MALYAAYGSNMDPAQMLARCPHSPQRGTGWLEGWRLTFGGEDIGWEGALTTVVEDATMQVFVVLYDVPEVDEKELDNWDGVTLGYYTKVKVRVQTLDEDALAWLYVLDGYEGGLPSARHLAILVDAAQKAGAPGDYVEWLRTRPSNPPSGSEGQLPALREHSWAGTRQASTATTRASAGMTIAATAGQYQVLTGGRAGRRGATARARSAYAPSAETTGPTSAIAGSPVGAPAAGDDLGRARVARAARISALACLRRDEPTAQE